MNGSKPDQPDFFSPRHRRIDRRATPGALLRGAHAAAALLLALVSLFAPALPALADDGRPGPFIFIHGLQGDGAARTARAMGCNTVYFDLPEDAPLNLDTIRPLITQADERGCRVIIGLRTKLAGDFRTSAENDDYASALREWLNAVVGGLKDNEAIDAWATDHYLERDISYTEDDFRHFLLQRYGSVDAINDSWGSDYGLIDDITRERTEKLDADQTYGVGRPSMDLADYERAAFHDVMQMWADQIRSIDPDTPLMTGRISLYRSLPAIPDAYDIVQPFTPPDILEPDVATHNAHAIQMARRGGKFDVIPWLRGPVPPSEAYSKQALYSWVLEAGLRGAVGVGLQDWARIDERGWVRNNLIDQLKAAQMQAPFVGDRPAPTAAVIHEPYAGGHQFAGTPAYGFITDYAVNDLATLAFSYRFGTIFGGLDYFRIDELADTDLGRYSVVLAPACLSIPPEAASALVAYVEGGGCLFTDLGAGFYQSGSWNPVSSPLAVLLGITGAREPEDRYGSFTVGETHLALPSLTVGMQARGTFVPGQGISRSMGRVSRYTFEGPATQTKGYPFQGPSWFVRPDSNTIPIATQSVRYDDDGNPYFLGPMLSQVGAGLAIFSPFAAWSFWPPQDGVHAALHCDLMRRRARYRLLSDALVDPAVGLSGSDDWLHLVGRTDAGAVQVLAGTAEHRAYLGATCTFSAEEREPSGRRSGVVLLEVELPAGAMRHCEAVPITVRPAVGEAHVRLSGYGPGLVAMEVGGNNAVWGREKRGARESFHSGSPTRIRIGLEDGLYPVEPGSTHQVELSEGRGRDDTMTVTADHRGVLDFWITVAGGRLSISPVDR